MQSKRERSLYPSSLFEKTQEDIIYKLVLDSQSTFLNNCAENKRKI